MSIALIFQLPAGRFRTARRLRGLLIGAICACADGSTEATTPLIPGTDLQTPFPIDGSSAGASSASTYKGLPLRLTDSGEPAVTAVDGVIGLVCVGMSNANQECADFQARVRTEFAGQLNRGVRVVNCAVGSHAIERWNDPTYDAVLWDRCITQQLPAAGVRLDQVRVVWHKAANQLTTSAPGVALPAYPAAGSDFEKFHRNLGTFAPLAKRKFPALQAVYTSSRSYGGFAESAGRGEPLSYEEGHALNVWLQANRSVDGVWYGWGPYLWAPACASGVSNGSGVCYDRVDFVADGVHPSPTAEAKVSRMLHQRLRLHAWYR